MPCSYYERVIFVCRMPGILLLINKQRLNLSAAIQSKQQNKYINVEEKRI